MIPEAWLALLQALGPHARHWPQALAAAGDVEALRRLAFPELRGLGFTAAAARVLKSPDRVLCTRWRRWLDRAGHGLITYGSEAYPQRLATLPDPPAALWLRGARPGLLAAAQLAVVGSRNPTAGGRANALHFARELSGRGLTVTSGLAVGIDGASHGGALEGPGGTVAVLGSGIDAVYPKANAPLAEQIAATGLIVSEYGPGTPVRKLQFPARNRIIAGLSAGTLVIEATRRSGSLITARLAADYGREVFALPGSIHNPLSRGCHALIRDGAKLVENVDDILLELAPQLMVETATSRPREIAQPASGQPPGRAQVLDLLGFEPVAANELAARSGLTAAELSSMLLHLEMDGAVEALPGARYCRLIKRS